MKKMRFLLVLTTMLLSSRFALAQVSLDFAERHDVIDSYDFAAVADSILAGVPGGPADINQDEKVDVMDITTMYNRIYNTRYFWFGNPRPTASDYTTKSGLAINRYNSISEVLAAKPTIKLDASQNGFILVPSGWDVSDVAMQDTGTGEYYTLTERDTKIVNHKVYYSSGKFSSAGNVTLKKKSDAEAFYKEKHPNNNNDNNNNRYFWFGNTRPTASDYTTKSGLAINKYNSISEVLVDPNIKFDASQDGYSQDGQNGFLLVPSSWDVSDVAMQDTGTGDYYTLKVRDDRNIVNHTVYYSSGKFSSAANVTLKKKSDAEAFYKEKHPNNNPNNNPDNNPDNNNGVTYIDNVTNCSANDASFATNDGASNGITFRLINKTGKYICFSGKYKLYIKQGDYNNWTSDASAEQELETHICGPDYTDDGWNHWYENPYKLAPDQALEFTLTEIKIYEHDYATGGVKTTTMPLDYYTNGSWHFMSVDKGNSIPAVKLGHGTKTKHNSAWLVRVRPIKSSDCLVQKGKKYNMIIYSADTSSPDWNCN